MANFRTHVGFSTVLGSGYAGAGWALGAPADAVLVAGGLCGFAGMLPDLDSDHGRPLREIMSFAAAVAPLLLVDRMQALGASYNQMVLAGGIVYLTIRFGVARLLARYTIHRGMFHSIPAALVFAGVAFLICGCSDLRLRYYNAGAVFVGYMSHLLLDELYSVEWARGRFRFKRSFGTALKLWSRSLWGNISTYAKLILVTALILGEPMVMERLGTTRPIVRIHRPAPPATPEDTPPDAEESGQRPDRNVYDTAVRLWESVTR